MERPILKRMSARWLFMLILIIGTGAETGKGAVDPLSDFLPWRGPDGEVLPFSTDQEVLDFLRTARVVSKKKLSSGVNQPHKVLLERDSIQAHAVFREVHDVKTKFEINGSLRLNFRDDFVFEVAAYEVSRLLGIRLVPPAVLREIDGNAGSLQMWVEGAMSEMKRREKKLSPPHPLEWARTRQVRYIFDELVHNEDRNLGNSLIDPDWNVWLIDHTRCFYPLGRITHKDRLTHISTGLWDALKNTPTETVRSRLEPYLTAQETDALVVRWERLVDHYSKEIGRLGKERVLF